MYVKDKEKKPAMKTKPPWERANLHTEEAAVSRAICSQCDLGLQQSKEHMP